MTRSHGLRAEPAFVRWASAEGISLVGSAVTTIVLPLVVFEATGSITQTGALYAVRVVPYLLFGIIAGPIADQGNRRFLIIGGNVAEGLLVATIPIAHALGVLTVAQVYVVGLLSATAFVFSDAAVFGAVPALVGPERLSAANGFLSALASGADIAGPVLGGALAATIGPANAVTVDAASFLVAAAMQSTIRSSFRTGSVPAGERLPIMAQVKRALRFVRGHRTVATLIGVGFGNSFAFGAVLGLLVPYGVTELGLSAEGRPHRAPLRGHGHRRARGRRGVRAAVPHRSGPLAHADHAAPLLGGGGRAGHRVGLDRRRTAAHRVLLVDRHHHQRRHHVPPAGRARRPALERQRARPHDRLGWPAVRRRLRRARGRRGRRPARLRGRGRRHGRQRHGRRRPALGPADRSRTHRRLSESVRARLRYRPRTMDDRAGPPPDLATRPGVSLRDTTEFDRLANFSDAIYAISLTLQVVSLEAPKITHSSSGRELWEALGDESSQILMFFISFIVIGSFWLAHHRFFRRLAAIDRSLLFASLIYLAFISFLPFPSSLLGDQVDNGVAVALYALCIAAVAGLEVVLQWIAKTHDLFLEPPSPASYRWNLIASSTPVAIFLVSIPVAFVSPQVAILIWLLNLPVGMIVGRRMPAEARDYYEQ